MTLNLELMPPERFDAWRTATITRFASFRRESGMRPPKEAEEEATGILSSRFPDGIQSQWQEVLEVRDDRSVVGSAWLEVRERDGAVRAMLYDLRAEDPAAALPLIEARAAAMGAATLQIDLFAQDSDSWAAIDGRGYRALNVQMLLAPLPAPRPVAGVRLERMTAEQYAGFEEQLITEFADDLVKEGQSSPEAARVESERQTAESLPEGVDTEDELLFVAYTDGVDEPVGVLWLSVERRSNGAHVFVLELRVDAAYRRRGYGAAIMRAAEDTSRQVGATSIGLHAFGSNEAARALYRSLGYREAEVLLGKEIS
ncbi:GNAT family N-acetyltransferase [Microbacterium paludicola]|uniref:GNAT family N-acetyltransferase n=1 Tax=Microbacterium paludicola TaxID=300019 RepID=UPI00387A6C91